jgi:hypothetical protein
MILMNIGKPLGNAKLTDISRSFDSFREANSDFLNAGGLTKALGDRMSLAANLYPWDMRNFATSEHRYQLSDRLRQVGDLWGGGKALAGSIQGQSVANPGTPTRHLC